MKRKRLRELFSRLKLDFPPKKTAYNMFFKDMQEKKGLKAAPVSQTSDIISREWKKVK